jgi:hypothetical protein
MHLRRRSASPCSFADRRDEGSESFCSPIKGKTTTCEWWKRIAAFSKNIIMYALFWTDVRDSARAAAKQPDDKSLPSCLKVLAASKERCTVREINRCFRAEALIHHPDKGGCEKKFRDLLARRDLLIQSLHSHT